MFFCFFLQKVLSNATVLNFNEFEHQKKYIKMIFEGSCDWKFSSAITGINYILKYMKKKLSF